MKVIPLSRKIQKMTPVRIKKLIFAETKRKQRYGNNTNT